MSNLFIDPKKEFILIDEDSFFIEETTGEILNYPENKGKIKCTWEVIEFLNLFADILLEDNKKCFIINNKKFSFQEYDNSES